MLSMRVCAVVSLGFGAVAAQPPAAVDCTKMGMMVPTAARSGGGDPCAASAGVVVEQRTVLNVNGNGSTVRDVARWDNPTPAHFRSACWEGMRSQDGGMQFHYYGTNPTPLRHYPRGFRGNLTLLSAAMPGNYFATSPTLGGSSECLLPPGSAAKPTGWQGESRQTVDQQVDLVTGVPLVQVTDLELPVGAATFRLTRTRSSLHAHSFNAVGGEMAKWPAEATDRLWDWTGSGWMISENPVLLIDDTRSDVVGEDDPPTCWLILDAHHSIPFQWVQGINRYEAPPRFRARLTFTQTLDAGGAPDSGVWGTVNGRAGWVAPPLEYKVSLYDGALTYTFAAVYEDVPDNIWDPGYLDPGQAGQLQQTSLHDRPLVPDSFRRIGSTTEYYQNVDAVPQEHRARLHHHPFHPELNPGLGIPYMGLCTKIEDKLGHTVEIDYCRPAQKGMDSGRGADCVECVQTCLKKGQISHVRLKEGSAVKWTLVYSHRQFPGVRLLREQDAERDFPAELNDYFNGGSTFPLDVSYASNPERYEMHGHSAIDRVYVYEGDVLGGVDPVTGELCLTTPSNVPAMLAGRGETAASEPIERFISASAPSSGVAQRLRDWRYRVRYDYNQAPKLDPELHAAWLADGREMDPRDPTVATDPAPTGPPLLVLTTVERREAAASAVQPVNRRAYVYGGAYEKDLAIAGTVAPYEPYENPFTAASGIFGQRKGQAAHLRVLPWLCAILDNEDISRALTTSFGTPEQPEAALTLEEIAFQRKANSGTFMSAARRDQLVGTAKVRFEPSPERLSTDSDPLSRHQTWRAPSIESFFVSSPEYGQCLTVNQERCHYDGHWATVGEYTRREGQAEKAYRFHRFLCYPGSAGAEPWRFESLRENYDRKHSRGPTQSVFLNPFRWHASQGTNELEFAAAAQNVNAPALDQPRFVVVVDEFGSRAAMMTEDVDYLDGAQGARKAGMTARTVYEINAWGYVLKSRRWEYSGDTASVTMKGVGEEFIYKAVGDVICSGTGWQADPCACGVQLQTRVEPPAISPSLCPPRAFLKELVLAEKRSIGWSVAESSAPGGGSTAGLVEFYEYGFNANPDVKQEDYPWSSRLHMVAMGVKKGTGGTPYYTTQRFYDPGRPGQLVCDVRFNSPAVQLMSAAPGIPNGQAEPEPAYAATFYKQFYHGAGVDCTQQVASTLQIQPPLRQRPGGSWYYPIEQVLYTEEGIPHWQITGLVKSPDAPMSGGSDQLERLLFTYTKYGAYGNVDYIVADAVPGVDAVDPSTPGYVLTVPSLPAQAAGLARISPTPALRYSTLNWYDFKGNLTDSFRPGKRWSVRHVVHDPDPEVQDDETVEELTFENLVRIGSGTTDYGPFRTETKGMRRLLKGRDRSGAVISKENVFFPGDISLVMSGSIQNVGRVVPAFETISQVVYRLDSFGRPRGADVLEPTPGPSGQTLMLPVGGREINDLGEVFRQWDYGGNVTRWTRNHLGQRLRKYVGSIDTQWGNPGQDATNTQGGTNEFGSLYDMVLKERTQFGATPNDVWQPTIERRYVRDPAWAHNDYYGTPPSSDVDSYVSRHSYDWRGRRVRTDEYELGDPWASSNPAPRLRTTLRYLDYVGREVLTVEFGPLMPATLAAALDPTLLVTSSTLPDAAAFLALNPRPVSISEKLYDAGDRVVEERSYDVTATGSGAPPYTARRTLYGAGGQEVFSQSADGRCEVVTLDGIGRVRSKALVRYGGSASPLGYELTRTDYTMDVEGRVTEESTWERVRDGGDALGTANAVPSVRWMWYNTEGQKTAEANLGTGVIGVNGWTEFRAPTSSESTLSRPDTGPSLNPVTLNFDGRGALPAWAQVTGSAYDRGGRVIASIAADGVVTTFTHRGDKVSTQVENATLPPSQRRTTTNSYTAGRMVGKNLVGTIGERPEGADKDKAGATCTYGAAVLDREFVVRSYDRTLIGAMGRVGGDLSTWTGSAEFVYSYNFQGQLAQRLAADGTVTRYTYDAAGRLATVEVGHTTTGTNFVVGYAASPASEVAADRIGFIEYVSTWSAVGGVSIETRDIIARIARIDPAHPTLAGRIISHVRQRFDGRGQLVQEWQSHGAPVTAGTPSIQYTWAYEAATASSAGRLRLSSMLYPGVEGGERRTVSIGYGAAGSLDDELCRIGSIASSVPGFGTANLSSYAYTGADRRASTSLGASGVVQTLDGDPQVVGLTGLDGFGRTRDLTFRNGAGGVLFGCGYDYDLADRIIAAKVSHVPVSAQAQVNTRSSVYGYDAFGRLTSQEIGAATGTWGAATGQWSVATAGKVRADAWHLDVLDNWSVSGGGLPDGGGRVSTGNLDWHGTPFAYPGATAAPNSLVSRAATTERSDLAQVRKSVDGGASSGAVVLRDALGRIVCDGLLYYHYDAWGRLVQVNVAKYSEGGGPGGAPEWTSSNVIRHLVYDGLGRLIRVQAPVVAPLLHPDVQQVELLGPMRSELLYYDGVRRIAEVVVDPVDPKAVALISEDLAEQQAAEQTQGESTAGGGGQKTANVSYEKAVSAATRVSREYVWGPGDCYAGIDELVAQFDGESRQTPWWALQDLSGDVVALVYKPANAAAAVAWQCTYEPYGGVLAEVSHVEHPRVHLGHKGLFVENLDSLEFTALEPDLQPRLAAQRPLLYHVRNRSMLAGEPVDEEGNARVWAGGLGRFLQPDPNATGVGVQSSVAFHGRGDLSILFDVGLTAWTNDGLHAVGYLRCSPMMHGDPLGLSLIDPLVTGGDDAAARAAQLQLIRSFGGASGLLARILSPAFAANAARAGSLGAGYLVLRFSWQQSQDYGAGAEGRNPAQDKMLTRGEIERLKDAGHDPHEMKPHPASRYDLYKDKDGNIYVKPKGGSGAGEPTNININHV